MNALPASSSSANGGDGGSGVQALLDPLLDPLWSPPAAGAPELQRRAYRQMMHALMRVTRRVPDVLARPAGVSGAQVMEAATAALLNPKIAREERIGALTLLQRRMRSVDPTTPARLYLARDPRRNPVATDFDAQITRLEGFEDELHRFVISGFGRAADASGADPDRERTLVALGALEAVLVTRLGYGSQSLVARILSQAGTRPRVCGKWAWVDVELDAADGVPQLRRIFLDAVALAAWIHAGRYASHFPVPRPKTKAAELARARLSLARDAFKALVRQMSGAGAEPSVTSLRSLCEAELQRLYVATMPLIATYAKGDIPSSSLDPRTWERLLGCAQRVSVATDQALTPAPATAEVDLSPDIEVSEPDALREGMAQGDLDEQGVIASLRTIMNGERSAWEQGFDTLLARLAPPPETHNTDAAACVVGWLRSLACGRSKRRTLSDGSVRYYRGLLANRLLQSLPPDLQGIDENELHDAYAEVVLSRTSPGQVRNLRMALGAFDRYVRTVQYPELPRVSLLAPEEGGYAISNRIISEAEYSAGLGQIQDGSLVTAEEQVKREVLAFWVLAFRLGLRRREILGLQVRDVDGDLVRVRANRCRTLKTANARRLLTLYFLPREEGDAVRSLAGTRPIDEFLFFGSSIPTAATLDAHPVVERVNALLERVTGERGLHPHNLRHSFATLFLLGSLEGDFDLARHPCTASWMTEGAASAAAMALAFTGALHRRAARGAALGLVMGHGSELTTYAHYVHCLDLLQFVACTHPQHPLRRSAPRDLLAAERAQVRAFLGRTDSFHLPGDDLFGAIPKIARTHRDDVLMLRVQELPYKPVRAKAETPGDGFPKLSTLLKDNASVPGCPESQAQRDTAAALLASFRGVAVQKRLLLASVFARWLAARINYAGWASMSAVDALAWVSDVQALEAGIRLEVRRVARDAAGDVKQMHRVARPFDRRLYRRSAARYWVRFADVRIRKPRRRKVEPRTRHPRTQGSVTWLVEALHKALTQ